jgi:hypothetical protein
MPGTVITLQPGQREVLEQALADAIFYRDPPLNCRACEAQDTLCSRCAAELARARSYLALSDMLNAQPGRG